jgi:hypothetical protein
MISIKKKQKSIIKVLLFSIYFFIFSNLFSKEQKGESKDLTQYLLTKPQKLFSLKYGKNANEIGLIVGVGGEGELTSTLTDFVVGYDGSIYIADNVNSKIKKFSRDGKLLMMTEGELEYIGAIGVDPKGRVFVIYYENKPIYNRVAVFDNNGKRMLEEEKKVKDLFEKLTLINPKIKNDSGISKVRCDSKGNVYFQGELTYQFEPGLSSVKVFKKGQFPYIDGQKYSFELIKGERQEDFFVYSVDGSFSKYKMDILQPSKVTIYNEDDSVLREFIIPKDGFNEIEKLFPIGGGPEISDESGNFYVIRGPLKIYHRPLDVKHMSAPDFFVICSEALVEYNREGKFIGIRVIYNRSGFTFFTPFQLDPEGDVYYLDFKSDRVDVMMAPAPKIDSKLKKRGDGKR